MAYRLIIVAFIFALTGCDSSTSTNSTGGNGRFEPKTVDVRLLEDGRKSELLTPFTYVDQAGRKWVAPEGEVVDGASIPQLFWSVIGGPYEGKYRYASVVHDRYCREPHGGRTWQEVHRMFYEACLAGGTDPTQAKLMYAAVYHFGPRWKDSEKGIEELAELIPPEQSRLADQLEERANRLASSPAPLNASPGRLAVPTEEEYRQMVLAPRGPAPLSNTASARVQKWDRLRDLLRNNPNATLEQIEQNQ